MLVQFEGLNSKSENVYIFVNVDKIVYAEFIKAWGDIESDYYKLYMGNATYVCVKAKSFESYIHGTYSKSKKLTIWQKIKIFFANWLKSLKMMKSSS